MIRQLSVLVVDDDETICRTLEYHLDQAGYRPLIAPDGRAALALATEEKPEIVGKGLEMLDEWHKEMMKTSSSDIDPMWTVVKEGGPEHTRRDLSSYLKRLKKTGREHLIKKILDRHENYLS